MITIKTETLKRVLDKSIKGCSFNKMIPITSLMSITVEDNRITLYSTDKLNYLKVTDVIDEKQDNFNIVVDAQLFYNLIHKTTVDKVNLSVNEDSTLLNIEGNGNYTLEIPIDEEGNMIRFPELVDIREESTAVEIDLESLREKLNVNKASLPLTLESKELNSYYFTDNIITTDAFKVCATNNMSKLVDTDMCLTKDFVELLLGMTYDVAFVVISGDNVQVYNDNFVLVGPQCDLKDKYPLAAIKNYLESDFANECSIKRKDLLEVLDRLGLFISPYDKNSIDLIFGKEGIKINSKKKNGVELISYLETDKKLKLKEDYVTLIDINMLKSQIEALKDENITIHFGNDKAIKITSKEVVQIVSLLEQE